MKFAGFSNWGGGKGEILEYILFWNSVISKDCHLIKVVRKQSIVIESIEVLEYFDWTHIWLNTKECEGRRKEEKIYIIFLLLIIQSWHMETCSML